MSDLLGLTPPAELSVITLLINLTLGVVIAFALAWHYKRYGNTFTNRADLAQVFPLIVLVTVLIISIVKSSLALSLGLVGALSIVRFRTPIKEPEELAYLFMAIGVGLGFGADQRIPTIAASIFILGVLLIRSRFLSNKENHNLYLNVEVSQPEDHSKVFQKINDVLKNHVSRADMRRLDIRDGLLQATYYVDCRNHQDLTRLVETLNTDLPGVSLSFLEQKGILKG
jgi:uncharacterized membrane protein YhiD involved in acid resistance